MFEKPNPLPKGLRCQARSKCYFDALPSSSFCARHDENSVKCEFVDPVTHFQCFEPASIGGYCLQHHEIKTETRERSEFFHTKYIGGSLKRKHIGNMNYDGDVDYAKQPRYGEALCDLVDISLPLSSSEAYDKHEIKRLNRMYRKSYRDLIADALPFFRQRRELTKLQILKESKKMQDEDEKFNVVTPEAAEAVTEVQTMLMSAIPPGHLIPCQKNQWLQRYFGHNDLLSQEKDIKDVLSPKLQICSAGSIIRVAPSCCSHPVDSKKKESIDEVIVDICQFLVNTVVAADGKDIPAYKKIRQCFNTACGTGDLCFQHTLEELQKPVCVRCKSVMVISLATICAACHAKDVHSTMDIEIFYLRDKSKNKLKNGVDKNNNAQFCKDTEVTIDDLEEEYIESENPKISRLKDNDKATVHSVIIRENDDLEDLISDAIIRFPEEDDEDDDIMLASPVKIIKKTKTRTDKDFEFFFSDSKQFGIHFTPISVNGKSQEPMIQPKKEESLKKVPKRTSGSIYQKYFVNAMWREECKKIASEEKKSDTNKTTPIKNEELSIALDTDTHEDLILFEGDENTKTFYIPSEDSKQSEVTLLHGIDYICYETGDIDALQEMFVDSSGNNAIPTEAGFSNKLQHQKAKPWTINTNAKKQSSNESPFDQYLKTMVDWVKGTKSFEEYYCEAYKKRYQNNMPPLPPQQQQQLQKNHANAEYYHDSGYDEADKKAPEIATEVPNQEHAEANHSSYNETYNIDQNGKLIKKNPVAKTTCTPETSITNPSTVIFDEKVQVATNMLPENVTSSKTANGSVTANIQSANVTENGGDLKYSSQNIPSSRPPTKKSTTLLPHQKSKMVNESTGKSYKTYVNPDTLSDDEDEEVLSRDEAELSKYYDTKGRGPFTRYNPRINYHFDYEDEYTGYWIGSEDEFPSDTEDDKNNKAGANTVKASQVKILKPVVSDIHHPSKNTETARMPPPTSVINNEVVNGKADRDEDTATPSRLGPIKNSTVDPILKPFPDFDYYFR